MITIKSNREIEIMMEAGRITALAHRKVKEAIKKIVDNRKYFNNYSRLWNIKYR